MSISSITNTAFSGLLAQQTRVANIANNVANADTPGYKRLNTNLSATTPSGVAASTTQANTTPDTSNVDPLEEMTGLISSEQAFAANAKVFETGADMWDMLMSIKKD
jgi:flagellar basal body rod protein FlgG